jgi:hypothetical protein
MSMRHGPHTRNDTRYTQTKGNAGNECGPEPVLGERNLKGRPVDHRIAQDVRGAVRAATTMDDPKEEPVGDDRQRQ